MNYESYKRIEVEGKMNESSHSMILYTNRSNVIKLFIHTLPGMLKYSCFMYFPITKISVKIYFHFFFIFESKIWMKNWQHRILRAYGKGNILIAQRQDAITSVQKYGFMWRKKIDKYLANQMQFLSIISHTKNWAEFMRFPFLETVY